VLEELTDRYGEPPLAVLNLIAVSRLRRSAQKTGLSEVVVMGGNLRVGPSDLPDSIQVRLQRMYPGARFFPQTKTASIPLPAGASDEALIAWVSGLLAAVFPPPAAAVPPAAVPPA
jgi:transcription-repair coupling factor (superfamily II helicase)